MQRQPKDKDATCQSTQCEERIFPVAHEGTPLKKAASFFIIEIVILQVEVDGCAGIVALIAQASWAKGRWLIVACFDDDGKWTYVVKSVHPVAPSTQQPTWPAVLLAKELSTVQETQMTNGAREALIAFLSDQIDTRGQSSRTETTRGCRVRVPVSRLRIDGAAAGAKRPAPTQEKKRTPAQEKNAACTAGRTFTSGVSSNTKQRARSKKSLPLLLTLMKSSPPAWQRSQARRADNRADKQSCLPR